MCGIAGFVDVGGRRSGDELRDTARRMALAMRHRGPDDAGEWVDPDAGIALSHRRLSIVDLSPHGHQPMVSHSGRYVLAFNGEIYNHAAIRTRIDEARAAVHPNALVAAGVDDAADDPADARAAPVAWRGHSDSEVLLEAIAEVGVHDAVQSFVGMFAFSVWDRHARVLHLVRDRLGEKPLYYGWMGNTFLWGSELKGLRAHPEWAGVVDRDCVALFLRHNYVPGPYSIYRNVRKVPPGTIVTMRFPSAPGHAPRETRYWSARETAEAGAAQPFEGSEHEAIGALDRLLRDAVAQQMVADVPLGAFLSGGVDSSTVVALMQAQSARRVRTFTIGFDEDDYNEAEYAKAVARHLGTDHTELYVNAEQARSVIPELPSLYDEPFSDSSQIPTLLLSRMTREHVKVSLSGDGGDELFGGYHRYLWGRTIERMPRLLRSMTAHGIRVMSPDAWGRALGAAPRFATSPIGVNRPGEKLHKLAEILAAPDRQMYLQLVSHWKRPESVVRHAHEPLTALVDPAQRANLPDFSHEMMYLDTISYLPDDILVKVDRAAMGVSLESRVPMLDHRVVEFAWRIPIGMKIRRGRGKWLLRQVLYRYVPSALVDRPKMGFGIPIGSWLRGPLRDWAEDLLDEKRLEREGYFDPQPIRRKWREHLSQGWDWHYYLWDVLMFQAWLQHERPRG